MSTATPRPLNHFFAALILAGGLLLLQSQNKTAFITTPLDLVTRPLRFPFVRAHLWLADKGEFFRNLPHQDRIIKDLKRRTSELALLSEKAAELERENAGLRSALKVPVLSGHTLLPVKILGLSRYAIVDRGSNAGVKKDQTVVSGGVYLGIVTEVWPLSARVRLLPDPETQLEARTLSGTFGTLTYQAGSLQLTRVIQKEILKVEEPIYTKGNATVPDGLLIGTIKKLAESPASVYKTAAIEPAANASDLDTMLILLD